MSNARLAPTETGKRSASSAAGVFLGLMLIGALAGDPAEEEFARNEVTTKEQVTTTEAPTTTRPPTTTKAPTTTAPPPPPTTAPPATAPPATEGPFAGETVSQRNARQTAADYLDYTSFSRSGLIKQVEYEGFTQADAAYGVDALNVDWDEQAAKKAAEYLDYTSFSRSSLIEQLLYEGFTQAQAEYGVGTTGL
ncbi:MAG TPA: Ltp family lipoprotein [Chloroflexota bacterium]|nr:Ltp family lipoprotein [Chloroflexota bacterium]